ARVQSATEAIISVEDKGRGIPPEKLDIIFERFQQVDASDSRDMGGTGLGLAICRNIVRQHGGRIWAESVVGKGSTFYFTVPRSAARQDA
ncbi:MAG TPA: ATP-binding protein, partial [Acidobacteriaceae bacterium]|nr:ATP-binding protein [Acidobacteriaceae bacterium]